MCTILWFFDIVVNQVGPLLIPHQIILVISTLFPENKSDIPGATYNIIIINVLI